MRKFLYSAVAIALAAGIGLSIGPTAEAGKSKALKLGTEAEDGFDEMVTRAKTLAYEFPDLADPTSRVARAFGASRTPEVFLFDANGKLAYRGAIDDNASDANAVESAYLKNALNALIAGKTISTTKTKALGCRIKYSSDS